MNDDLRTTVIDALLEVAPEVDPSSIDGAVPLQEQLDLDSMDFMAFLEAVASRTGIEVPDQDFDRVATLDGCVAYLQR